MKLTLISILSCALLVAALPQDTYKPLWEKCSNNQLSCCSDLKNSAEATGGSELEGGNIVSNTVVELTSTIDQVSENIPISILSGCAPILGAHNSDSEIILDIDF